MADTETQTITSDIKVEDAGACLKKITIEIAAEAVDAHIDESIDTVAAEASMPGFRKGRAPRRLVEKKFGSAVREETKNRLVAQAYQEAIEKHELKVVGDPQANELNDLEVVAGKPISFTVEVEVMPEFDLPGLDNIKVQKPLFEVNDELVERELDKLCVNEGELEERDTPEAGDYLTGHGIMLDADGAEHHNIQGAVVQIPTADKDGKGMVLGVLVEDFAKQLGLPKPGETATIKTKGPENHEIDAVRGADLTITFKVETVQRIIKADPADLAKRYGFENLDGFKQAIRGRLEQRAAVDQQSAMRQQIAQHLLKGADFQLPERLSAQQAQRTFERRRLELMYRGADPAQIEEHIAELRTASTDASQRELKLFFMLNKAAEQLEVQVSESELNGQIARLAIERGQRPEQFRQELIQNNRIASLYQQLREHKTMDAILSKADITDVKPEDYKPGEDAPA